MAFFKKNQPESKSALAKTESADSILTQVAPQASPSDGPADNSEAAARILRIQSAQAELKELRALRDYLEGRIAEYTNAIDAIKVARETAKDFPSYLAVNANRQVVASLLARSADVKSRMSELHKELEANVSSAA
jgi:hypothetical protein